MTARMEMALENVLTRSGCEDGGVHRDCTMG